MNERQAKLSAIRLLTMELFDDIYQDCLNIVDGKSPERVAKIHGYPDRIMNAIEQVEIDFNMNLDEATRASST